MLCLRKDLAKIGTFTFGHSLGIALAHPKVWVGWSFFLDVKNSISRVLQNQVTMMKMMVEMIIIVIMFGNVNDNDDDENYQKHT